MSFPVTISKYGQVGLEINDFSNLDSAWSFITTQYRMFVSDYVFERSDLDTLNEVDVSDNKFVQIWTSSTCCVGINKEKDKLTVMVDNNKDQRCFHASLGPTKGILFRDLSESFKF